MQLFVHRMNQTAHISLQIPKFQITRRKNNQITQTIMRKMKTLAISSRDQRGVSALLIEGF
jgi:hypothetical protein